ncbi:tetratricopeptide repeat protein [Mucilaginibacter sp. HMF5004]|uniref:tetratricopeptide repeat-containing hybrid sensor histidine kinase/response regulator n=1 Tax=Mucilaginibacter rivuli TaxID=2857527 RepID=UPI001C5D72A5|nr:tetratricopeptide repeat protein [Mucilaginibacter rivuli]MBW4891256.1 tetratricopeptide repeat protein [Mucilaginibacter rivuli]
MDNTFTDNTDQVLSLLGEANASRINNLKLSISLAQKALTLSRKMEDKALTGKSLNQLALYHMILGDYKKCLETAEEAIVYFKELDDERGVADAKYSIAGIYYKTDNYHLALIHLVNCIATYRKFGDHYNEARTHKSLGTIYEFFGDHRNAISSYENTIELAKKAGDLNIESNAYNPLSGIYLKQNEVKKAFTIVERAIAMKQGTGDTRGLAFSIYARGKAYFKMNRFVEAEQDFKESLRIHLEMGEILGTGMAYLKMAALYMETGRTDEAKNTLNTALAFANTHNIMIIKFKCSYRLYLIYKQENDMVMALQNLEQYLTTKESVINTQTLKIIENYEHITKMESFEKEAKLQKEKADIIEKKEIAERSAKVKQDFLSTMSHEIRTPLNAVITITSLLKDKSDPEDQQLLSSLKFASNNLLLIINDILDFNKLETGKVNLDVRSVNFVNLLENIYRTYDSMAKEKGLKLNLNVGSGIAENYELDGTKISQILGNLISNAIKYTDYGHVNFNITKIKDDQSSDWLRFNIVDTGPGIPESYFSEMFESFSQPKSITTRKHGGSGLGLAIVKKLVELHDSRVQFISVMNKGSEFYFDLQLKRSVAPIKSPTKRSDELKNKTILLAEDNMINAMVARKLLSNWGIISEHAKDGLEAVKKANEKEFDFILMDIHMPEMNGYDATSSIRNSVNPNQNTPIFALTADITAEHEEEYTTSFNGFLRKPIEIDKLYEALTTVNL